MIVGARIGVPAFVGGRHRLAADAVAARIGFLGPHDPFRKIGFLFALARSSAPASSTWRSSLVAGRRGACASGAGARRAAAAGWKRTHTRGSSLWVLFWGVALTLVATLLLGQPLGYVLFAIAAGVPVRVHQRHLAGHLRLEPDLQRVRRHRAAHGGASACAIRSSALMAASVLLVSPARSASTCSRTARRAGGWDRTAPSSSAIRRRGIVMGACCASCSPVVHEGVPGAARGPVRQPGGQAPASGRRR